jgi:RimJ/RimL family protein N-acetyltransferase
MYGGSLTSGDRPTLGSRRSRFEGFAHTDSAHPFCIEADGRYIGFVILGKIDQEHLSGSYRIGIENPAYWGRGYGTEVTRLMLRYAFETLGLHRIGLRVADYNARAARCYEKSGFRLEGVERDSFFVDGQWHDDLLMAALSDEWRTENAQQAEADGITIRSYRSSDYERVAALWREAWGELRPSDARGALEYKVRRDRGPFLVADADGKLVGTALLSWDGRWAWVTRLAVHPDYRRRGIARKLMAEIERAAAELRASQISLLTHRENAAAIGLYESLGYKLWDFVGYMSKRMDAGGGPCC